MTRKHLVLPLALLLGAGLSCDRNVTGPPTTGGISVVLVGGTAGMRMSIVARGEDPSDAVSASDHVRAAANANVALDGVRVTVSGPTNKTVTNNTPTGGFFDLTVDGLDPGTYTVTVEGLVGGQVEHFGQTSTVNVTAGNTTPASVTFDTFQPQIPSSTVVDTTDVLHFTISFSAVNNATSYVVSWSLNSDMSGAQSKTITTTSTDVQVTTEGKYYVTVRAVNSAVATGGIASAAKAVFVFQGVATVTVTPATPTIAAGATQQFTAVAKDGDGTVVANVNWLWVSDNQSVATVSQTGLATGVSGGSATIIAVGKGTPGNTALSVTPPPATRLAFSVQPINTTAAISMAAVQVAVQGATGATVTSDNATSVTVAIGNNAGGGTLSGTATATVVGGVANFTTLSIDKSGVGYTLTATANALTSATSATFNITAAGANKVAFIVQPTNATAGDPLSPAVQVEIQDAGGNRVTTAGDAVTMAISVNPGSSTLSGTKVVNAINGVASFSGLSLDKAGTGYRLGATATGLTGAPSALFNIAATAPATILAFSIQPTTSVAGDALSPAVQVEIRDGSGKVVTSARDAVTIAIGTNPGSGTLTGTKTVNAINGIASFTGVWINKTGNGYTLTASATGLTGAPSSGFNITPGAPAKLAFSAQPTNVQGNAPIAPAVTVTIADQYDNAVTTATNSVTIGINDNPWKTAFSSGSTLNGTKTVAAVAGVATFSTLRVDKPSPGYTLGAVASGLAGSISSSFNVNLAFSQLSVGYYHTCGITLSGAYCFGQNGNGQLGMPNTAPQDSIASLVRTAQTFVTTAAGANHSCGLTAAGAAYCWGYNGNGQLGNNSTSDSDVPVLVLGGHVFASIDAGSSHTCGVTTAGAGAENRQVYCWGYNGTDQLGDSTVTERHVPAKVKWPDAFKAAGVDTITLSSVTTGANHSCAVSREGKGFCWGYDYWGQAGDGAAVPGGATRVGPIQVVTALVTTWTTINASQGHTCGIAATPAGAAGKPYCWGYNGYGQLGDGTFTPRSSPVQASNTGGWTAIGTGANHSCGILSGAAYCWGLPYDGELGNDNTNDVQSAPVVVSGGINTFAQIDGGQYHTCARTTGNLIYCWGYNSNGQLGSPGTNGIKKTPAQIIQ